MKWIFSLLKKKSKHKTIGLERNPEKYMNDFFDSLFGYSDVTVKTYKSRLLHGPHCFLSYIKREKIESFNKMTIDQLFEYRRIVQDSVCDTTANSYVTAIRQLFKYLRSNGHITENISLKFHLPETTNNSTTQVLDPKLVDLLLNTNFCKDPLKNTRNSIIMHFLLKTGITPSEISNIEMGDIERFEEFTVIGISGKGGIRRDEILDSDTVKILNKYISLRGASLTLKGVISNELIITQGNPGSGLGMSTPGIAAMVKRFLKILQANGCEYNLKGVNPRSMNKTAKVNHWEPKYIQKGAEKKYIKLKEAFLKGDRGFMNEYRVIKEG